MCTGSWAGSLSLCLAVHCCHTAGGPNSVAVSKGILYEYKSVCVFVCCMCHSSTPSLFMLVVTSQAGFCSEALEICLGPRGEGGGLSD